MTLFTSFPLLLVVVLLPAMDGLLPSSPRRLLLAVDIGSRRSGCAFYDEHGQLVDYAGADVRTSDELDAFIEGTVGRGVGADGNDSLSYLVMEGGDKATMERWRSRVDKQQQQQQQRTAEAGDCICLAVKPELWRASILLPRERKNSQTCKQSARAVARQVVARGGIGGGGGIGSRGLGLELEAAAAAAAAAGGGAMNTDVAEAICLGLWASAGWLGGRAEEEGGEAASTTKAVDIVAAMESSAMACTATQSGSAESSPPGRGECW